MRALGRLNALIVATLAIGASFCFVASGTYFALTADPLERHEVLRVVSTSGAERGLLSSVDSGQLRSATPTIVHIRGYLANAVVQPIGANGPPRPVSTRVVDGPFFEAFEAPLKSGRFWTAEEAADRVPVALISSSLARSLFGTTEAKGLALMVNGRTFEVLGVLADWRPFPRLYDTSYDPFGTIEDLFIPLSSAPEDNPQPAGMVVCPEGESVADIWFSQCKFLQHWADANGDPVDVRERVSGAGPWEALPLSVWMARSGLVDPTTEWLTVAAFLFFLACGGNAMTLFGAKARLAASDSGVRMALGAGQFLLAGQFAFAAIVTGILAGALGVAVGYGIAVLISTTGLFGEQTVLPSSAVAVATIAATAVAAVAASFPGCLFVAHSNRILELRNMTTKSSARRGHLTQGMPVVEAAFAAAIVVLATGLFTTLSRNVFASPGFDLPNTLGIIIGGPRRSADEIASREADLGLLRSLPGVIAATEITAYPMSGGGWSQDVASNALDSQRSAEPAAIYAVDDSGLGALGVRLHAGRNFLSSEVLDQWPDSPFAPKAAIVTSALAARLYGNPSAAIGKPVFFDATTSAEIVGVISDLRSAFVDGVALDNSVLLPFREHGGQSRYLVRVVPGSREQVAAAIEKAMAPLAATRPVSPVYFLEHLRDQAVAPQLSRLRLLIVVLFGVIACVLIGLYARVANDIVESTREIATRFALGATVNVIVRRLLSRTAVLLGIGTPLGAALSIFLKGEWPLGGLSEVIAACAALVSIQLLATMFAAHRVLRIPPALALRA